MGQIRSNLNTFGRPTHPLAPLRPTGKEARSFYWGLAAPAAK
jgi:hypothetical protein